MTSQPLPDTSTSADPSGGPIFGPAHLTRLLIFALAGLFALGFRYVAVWLNWPLEKGFGGSLVQPMRLGIFVAVLMLLIVCTVIGNFFLGKRWYMAGLLTATAGLMGWSIRGGNMTHVLFNAQNAGVGARIYVQMLGELIVLFGVIGGLWNWVWVSGRSTPKHAPGSNFADGKRRMEESAGMAVLAQLGLMFVVLMLLSVTPLKKQALVSVFVAGLIATAIAEMIGNRSASRWYWVAPLAIGAAGYLTTYFNPMGLEIGDPQGMFAPLARILPLDYASLGCAGVLFGIWWMEPEDDESAEEDDQAAEPSASDTQM